MMDILKSKVYVVTIPEASKRIKWLERNRDERANLRNYNIFVDLILAYAVMRWPCRPNYEDDDGVVHIEATRQDFMDALALYHTVHAQMETKLTSKEIEVVKLVKDHRGRISREEAMKEMKVSKGRMSHLINGKNGNGGLLSKYPGFYIEEATESETETGRGAGDYCTRHIKSGTYALLKSSLAKLM